MKTLNTNLHTSLRFAAAILTLTCFAVAGNSYAGDDVPFKGYVVGGGLVPVSDLPDICPDEFDGLGDFVFLTAVSGQISGLGETTVDIYTGIYFSDIVDGDDVVTLRQLDIYTAANGDEVWAYSTSVATWVPNSEGGISFPSQDIIGIESTICGGTGRFEGAEGSYEFLVRIDGTVLEAWFDGTISTVGSRGGNGKK